MTASCFRVLTTNSDAPVMTKTTVQLDFLHTLNVLTKGLIQEIGILLAGLAVLDIALTIDNGISRHGPR